MKTHWFGSPRLLLYCGLVMLGLGIFANPWLTTIAAMGKTLLATELVILAIAWSWALIRAGMMPAIPLTSIACHQSAPQSERAENIGSHGIFVIVVSLWLVLYRGRWLHPYLFNDDVLYVRAALDWPTTRAHLFTPFNEHLVVSARLLTWLGVSLSRWFDGWWPVSPEQATWTPDSAALAAGLPPGPAHWLPFVLAWLGIGLFAANLLLLRELATRLWHTPWAGVAATIFFALTTGHRECVVWWSASQWLVSTLCLNLALLLLTPKLPQPSRTDCPWTLGRLSGAAVLCALAPFCYALGLLVGPVCILWLWGYNRLGLGWYGRLGGTGLLLFFSGLGLAGIWPILQEATQQPEYQQSVRRGLLAAFDLPGGVLLAARLSVDGFLLRNLGFCVLLGSWWWYALVFPWVPAGLLRWYRQYPQHGRVLLPLVIVLLGYGLIAPFRTWGYYGAIANESRFQLIPQLGWSLFLVGLCFGPPSNKAQPTTDHDWYFQRWLRQGWFWLVVAVGSWLLHEDKAGLMDHSEPWGKIVP